jgi:hypothetical protein
MERLVREHLNEKFSEETSDPINDMGIGGYSFDLLKPGAILKAKMRTSINKDDSGYFTNWGKGYNVDAGEFMIVVSIRNYILKGYREIKIYIPGNRTKIEDTKQVKEELQKNPNYSGWGSRTRMILTKVQFNSKFEVIEKGWD